jgi:hypothetical protein
LGEILEMVGLHGLDEKIIAKRVKEGEIEEAMLEGEKDENDNKDEKEIIGELKKTHISEDTNT